MTKPQIAIVVQRYGSTVLGGAETAAREIAEHLVELGDVHVLTTCAKNFTTWENSFPPGVNTYNQVTIHRFPVDFTRNWQKEVKQTGQFWQQNPSLEEQMKWIQVNGPFSTPLIQYIKQNEKTFDVFIFFTYLYATTFFCLPLVAHKSILIPTAHDEPLLYEEAYRILFNLPHHIIYLTEAEQEITNNVTGNHKTPSTIAALGLHMPDNVSAERFRQKHGIYDDFLIYGGRITQSKNIPELLDFFQLYQEQTWRKLKLVLMGEGNLNIPPHPDIIPIGFVSDEEKFDALKAASILIQPSHYESLSIIMLQAWLMKTMVLVNSQCAVTKQQCQISNGGCYYNTYEEFAGALDYLMENPCLRDKLGKQGHKFVLQRYKWEEIMAKYKDAICQIMNCT